MENISLKKASQEDIRKIIPYLTQFKLDSEDISLEQFIVAEINGNLAGFGRIKSYENIHELSSVGVLEEYRNKGIGTKIIKYLIDIFPSNEIWITTKVNDYFQKFGFKKNDNPPDEIKQKCKRICMDFYESPGESSYMVFKKSGK